MTASETHEVELDFFVAVFARPRIERRACNLIDDGDRNPQSREIDTL